MALVWSADLAWRLQPAALSRRSCDPGFASWTSFFMELNTLSQSDIPTFHRAGWDGQRQGQRWLSAQHRQLRPRGGRRSRWCFLNIVLIGLPDSSSAGGVLL